MALPYATTTQLEKAISTKQDKITVTAEDAGKIVAVDEEGKLSLVDAPSGGTKLYRYDIYFSKSTSYPSDAGHVVFISNRDLSFTSHEALDEIKKDLIIDAINNGVLSRFVTNNGTRIDELTFAKYNTYRLVGVTTSFSASATSVSSVDYDYDGTAYVFEFKKVEL